MDSIRSRSNVAGHISYTSHEDILQLNFTEIKTSRACGGANWHPIIATGCVCACMFVCVYVRIRAHERVSVYVNLYDAMYSKRRKEERLYLCRTFDAKRARLLTQGCATDFKITSTWIVYILSV